MNAEARTSVDAEFMLSPGMFVEQRRTPRKELRLSAIVRLADGSILNSQTADVSRDGIGFVAPRSLKVGSDCTLNVPIDACGTAAVLRLVGRVCHCQQQSEDLFRIGMQFIRMDEQTAAIVSAALR